MANTFDSNLLTRTLGAAGVTVLGNNLAPLRVFTADFSSDVVRPLSTVSVPVVTTGSAAQKNPTNFATGDTTATGAQVVLNHYSKSFHVTSKELNEGKRLETLAAVNMQILANAIWADVAATLTTGNFSTSSVSTTGAADFSREDLQLAWGEIKGTKKGAVLKDDYFARILPADQNSFSLEHGLGLFSEGVHSSSVFPGATSGVVGFVAAPQALAIAAAIPEKNAIVAEAIDSELVEVPGLGLMIEVNTWADTNTRTVWASFDTCFGLAVADTSALRLIKQ